MMGRTASTLRSTAAAATTLSFTESSTTARTRAAVAAAALSRASRNSLLHTAAVRRPTTTAARRSSQQQRAGLHVLPTLPARFANESCEPFLSQKAFQLVSREWQQGLFDRLNDEVRGTELEMSSISETVLALAQDRSKALAFNYASQALNNSFFLNGLMPKTQDGPSPVPTKETSLYPGQRTFLQAMYASYQNLSSLKSAFSAAAMGMTSSGWVWLVRDAHGKLGVVSTYGAGTLLVQARQQMGDAGALTSWIVDPNAESAAEGEQSPSAAVGKGKAGAGGVTAAAGQDVSAVQRDNVGGAMGGGVIAPSTAPAPAMTESKAGEGKDDTTANRVVPPASGSSVSPAAKGNMGGTIGGGIGVRSFSTTSSNPGPMLDDLAGTLGKFVNSGSSANQGGYGAASPNGQGFRRSTMRRSLDEYEADAGTKLYPLLCVSVHEHAWMADYGLWGKEEYLRQFWECVDWSVVDHLYTVYE
ncbi:hypothetical protein CF326_g7140 [Tilletia indica]|nr:hypothetical protein CF326_g7140 [Tilletia indica]